MLDDKATPLGQFRPPAVDSLRPRALVHQSMNPFLGAGDLEGGVIVLFARLSG
jgi:hypothetical protein